MTVPMWNAAQAPLVLEQRKFETHDTASFFFRAPEPAVFHFKPGQFVTLRVEIDGRAHARSYSISSLPGQDCLQLTVKRVAGGLVSNWLIDHLQPGNALWTYGVAGAFNIQDCQPREEVLMISAGCGITPVMAMSRALIADEGADVKKIDFLHCARDGRNVIYLEEMLSLAEEMPSFREHLLLERQGTRPVSKREHAGLISLEKLQAICPDYKNRTVYLCGPAGFMEAVETILRSSGFDMEQLFKEEFAPKNDNDEALLGSDIKFTVTVPGFTMGQKARQGDILLDVLERASVPIIGACRSGVCGSCKCRVTKGAVESASHATLSVEEQAHGYVLACSSKVIGNVEIALT